MRRYWLFFQFVASHFFSPHRNSLSPVAGTKKIDVYAGKSLFTCVGERISVRSVNGTFPTRRYDIWKIFCQIFYLIHQMLSKIHDSFFFFLLLPLSSASWQECELNLSNIIESEKELDEEYQLTTPSPRRHLLKLLKQFPSKLKHQTTTDVRQNLN